MTPKLVTPPAVAPVTLEDAKLHCRIDHNEDDGLIGAFVAAAVGHLDGWTGVLGRCIMPQTWSVTVAAGEVVLPMPDVTEASFGGAPLAVTASAMGPVVTAPEAGEVTFTCAMPHGLFAAARVAVLLLVGHWYANREAAGAALVEAPMAVEMLVAQMRWRRV